MEKVAIYLRCSTVNQNLETQRMPILDFCVKNGLEIFKEYSDEGFSGTTSSRPKLDELINDMRAGKFNIIILWRLDRLARSLRNLIDILSELRKKKIRLISLSDGIDTKEDSPMSNALWQLMGVFGELERSIIVERVKAGLNRVRQEGRTLGRPLGKRDKVKRSVSGYRLRYAGKSKNERRLGKRNKINNSCASTV